MWDKHSLVFKGYRVIITSILKKIKNKEMKYLSEVFIADGTVHVEHGHA
jgi:hypothetical protein